MKSLVLIASLLLWSLTSLATEIEVPYPATAVPITAICSGCSIQTVPISFTATKDLLIIPNTGGLGRSVNFSIPWPKEASSASVGLKLIRYAIDNGGSGNVISRWAMGVIKQAENPIGLTGVIAPDFGSVYAGVQYDRNFVNKVSDAIIPIDTTSLACTSTSCREASLEVLFTQDGSLGTSTNTYGYEWFIVVFNP